MLGIGEHAAALGDAYGALLACPVVDVLEQVVMNRAIVRVELGLRSNVGPVDQDVGPGVAERVLLRVVEHGLFLARELCPDACSQSVSILSGSFRVGLNA